MGVYAVDVGGRIIAVFDASSEREAKRHVHGKSGLANDWLVLESDGRPIWDGEQELSLREATPIEYNRWQAWRTKEIDSGDYPDEGEELVHLLYFIPVQDPTSDIDDDLGEGF